MELKLRPRASLLDEAVGSNWTFMELKHNLASLESGLRAGSNWTFMELKQRVICRNPIWVACSNWTFMELKQACAAPTRRKTRVLIEPLWNWNRPAFFVCWRLVRSNWTFMELKQARHWEKWVKNGNVLIEPLWNWNTKRKTHTSNTGAF